MTKPTTRVAPIQKAIDELKTEERRLTLQHRTMVSDMKASPKEIEKVSAELRSVREKRDNMLESLKVATEMDRRDHFLAERERIQSVSEEALQLLATRVGLAAEIDQACEVIGAALDKLAEINHEAWRKFTDVARELTRGDPRRARYDGLVSANQSRILTGAAFSDALVYALKNAGVGQRGVSADLLYPVASYRGGNARSIADAVHEANERVERHLAYVFQQVGQEAAGLMVANFDERS